MKKSSFIQGTFIATFAIVLVKIMGMLYVIPFYAMIGIQGSALYAYAYNIYVLFLDISTAGIPNAVSKIVNEYNTLKKMEAKVRAYKIGKNILLFISIIAFIILFVFANQIGSFILGNISGGNTIKDVAFALRCVSLSILIVPFLSISRGYFQGHRVINVSSFSQIIEQVVRIIVILSGTYLAIKVLKLSITTGVGIAILGSFIGGLVAIFYIYLKIIKNKKELNLDTPFIKQDNITNKEIIKKIINYAIPVIIISVSVSIYNSIDMVLILRTIAKLGFSGIDAEFISSAIVTWSGKLNQIVTAIGSGMTISLIPAIVSSYTLKKYNEVNQKCNSALQIILFISIPMVVGLALLGKPVWTIFYGYNKIGVIILTVNIFVALFLNLFMVTNFTLQSMNLFKMVYLCSLLGFVLNGLLDVPLMYLFHYLKIPAYLGAIAATICGYSFSILTALIYLKKKFQFKYRETWKVFLKVATSTFFMIIVIVFLKLLFPLTNLTRINSIIYVVFISLIGALIYFFISYKLNIINDVFGSNAIKKVLKKLTFKK